MASGVFSIDSASKLTGFSVADIRAAIDDGTLSVRLRGAQVVVFLADLLRFTGAEDATPRPVASPTAARRTRPRVPRDSVIVPRHLYAKNTIPDEVAAAKRADADAKFRRGLERRGLGIDTGHGRSSAAQLIAILAEQGGRCAYCDALAEQVDHKHPVSRGGGNAPENLQWLCGFHNSRKGDWTDEEYREAIGLKLGSKCVG